MALNKKQFVFDYNNYILPYNCEIGIDETDFNRKDSRRQWIDTFINREVQFVEHKNQDWYNSYKYVNAKWGLTYPYTYLGATDMNLLNALNIQECQRRCLQVLELCCELYNTSVQVYPVHIWPGRVHPGNTALHALKILEKSCKIIRVVPRGHSDAARVIANLNSIEDIQNIYNKRIYAFFIGLQKSHGLQVLVKHGTFDKFDSGGNLAWSSDENPWPADKFLSRIVKKTKHCTGEQNTIILNDIHYDIIIPYDKLESKNIFLEMFEWGSTNL